MSGPIPIHRMEPRHATEEFSNAVAMILGRERRGREQIVAVGVNCSNPNYMEVSHVQQAVIVIYSHLVCVCVCVCELWERQRKNDEREVQGWGLLVHLSWVAVQSLSPSLRAQTQGTNRAHTARLHITNVVLCKPCAGHQGST